MRFVFGYSMPDASKAMSCRLHDEIVAFLQYISPSPAELSARHKVLTRLTEVVQRRFLTSEVKIFGSVAQGLSLPGGWACPA